MIKLNRIFSALILGLAVATVPLQAKDGATFVEERFKSALNDMVQKVHATQDPAAKRQVLVAWTVRLDNGLEQVMRMESLDAGDRAGLASMRTRFQGYRAELEGRSASGQDGLARVDDAQLDAFAAYMQQDTEQAPIGGGVYISAGTLIIILLLIILLT